MTVEAPFSIQVTDLYRKDIPSVSGTNVSAKLTYSERPDFDEDSILSHGSDISITYPVSDIAELDRMKHLSVQVVESNRKQHQYSKQELNEIAVAARFDQCVIDLIDCALGAEGCCIEDFDQSRQHLKALIIHDAWKLESKPALVEHLERYPDIAEQLGYEDIVGQSMFNKIDNRLEDTTDRETLRNAAKRIVHAIWRNGHPLPSAVTAGYELEISPIVNETTIAPSTRRAALTTWIEELLPTLIEPISFDRYNNSSYSVTQIIGSIAQGALIDGLYAAKPMAGWHYNDEDLIGSRQLSDLAASLSRRSILNTFGEITQRFISIADEFGFFESAYNYALDTTWVSWGGDYDAIHLIDNPDRCETGTGWCFAALTIMAPEARFALGINLVSDKSETVHQFHRLLRDVARNYPVAGVYIDREFTSGQAVNMCRDVTDRWAIRSKVLKGPIEEEYAEAEVDEPHGPTQIEFAGVTPQPQIYYHPLTDQHRKAANETHMPFLLSRHIDGSEAESMYKAYQHRWSIETYFRQLKNEFAPTTNSPDEEIRLFLYNIASVFYNIHTLINRAPSPEYGLRLDAAYYEVLQAIVEFAFERCGPYN